MNQNSNPSDAPFYAEIRRYCVRLINSETEADDLVQEVYIRMYESDRNLKDAHLRNWLFRVARNLVIDKLRVKRPKPFASDDDEAALSENADDKSVNPAAAAEQQELIQNALSLLKQCDKRTREIFRLKFYECKSSSEIGTKIGVSSSTVRKILLGKLQEFREAFQQKGAIG